MELNKEARINFASTQYVPGFTRHSAGMMFTHPLQVVRIVSVSFKLASVPRPKALALSAEHLITSFGFMNRNLAVGAWFGVSLKKCNRSDRVRVADMISVVAVVLEFPAIGAGVFLADAALPSGRDKAVAV